MSRSIFTHIFCGTPSGFFGDLPGLPSARLSPRRWTKARIIVKTCGTTLDETRREEKRPMTNDPKRGEVPRFLESVWFSSFFSSKDSPCRKLNSFVCRSMSHLSYITIYVLYRTLKFTLLTLFQHDTCGLQRIGLTRPFL